MRVEPSFLHKILVCDSAGFLEWLPRTMETFGPNATEGRVNHFNRLFAGKPAFTYTDELGYRKGIIFRKQYSAHHVVWAMTHGAWPTNTIDHIDKNPSNNAPSNLRDVEHQVNCLNRRRRRTSKSKFRGVDFIQGKWRARIAAHGRTYALGYYESDVDAARAYNNAAVEIHGAFAQLNDLRS